jgi:hypothetical protein
MDTSQTLALTRRLLELYCRRIGFRYFEREAGSCWAFSKVSSRAGVTARLIRGDQFPDCSSSQRRSSIMTPSFSFVSMYQSLFLSKRPRWINRLPCSLKLAVFLSRSRMLEAMWWTLRRFGREILQCVSGPTGWINSTTRSSPRRRWGASAASKVCSRAEDRQRISCQTVYVGKLRNPRFYVLGSL